jgi:hypothetical protein
MKTIKCTYVGKQQETSRHKRDKQITRKTDRTEERERRRERD